MARLLTIDQTLCISCSLCVDMLPGIFRINEDNSAEVYNQGAANCAELESIRAACPLGCILWIDA